MVGKSLKIIAYLKPLMNLLPEVTKPITKVSYPLLFSLHFSGFPKQTNPVDWDYTFNIPHM